MPIHLHGSWLVLIGNARINSGVISHFVLSFSYLIDNRKCWDLTPKLTRLYRQFMLGINFLFILRKSVNFSVILFSNRKMNSTIAS